jgi:hypothetical protein
MLCSNGFAEKPNLGDEKEAKDCGWQKDGVVRVCVRTGWVILIGLLLM